MRAIVYATRSIQNDAAVALSPGSGRAVKAQAGAMLSASHVTCLVTSRTDQRSRRNRAALGAVIVSAELDGAKTRGVIVEVFVANRAFPDEEHKSLNFCECVVIRVNVGLIWSLVSAFY